MDIYKFPILKFIRLLQNDTEVGFCIGIEEYKTVFKTLQEGFGLTNVEDLKNILAILLVKNERQIGQFDFIFQAVVDDYTSIIEIEIRKSEIGEVIVNNNENRQLEIENNDNEDENNDIDFNNEIPDDKGNDINSEYAEKNDQPNYDKKNESSHGTEDRETNIAKFNKVILKYPFVPKPQLRKEKVNKYFPASGRDLAQSFQYLKTESNSSISESIDIVETINKICQNAFYLEPIFKQSKQNQLKLSFLIDSSKSMIPFTPITNEIVKASEYFLNAEILYFDNIPNQYLYYERNRRRAIKIQKYLSDIKTNTHIVVISDSGAARSTFNEQRIKKSIEFIRDIYRNTKFFVWFNPVPIERWQNNTAFVLSSLNVPMFSLDVLNFRKGIDILRNKF